MPIVGVETAAGGVLTLWDIPFPAGAPLARLVTCGWCMASRARCRSRVWGGMITGLFKEMRTSTIARLVSKQLMCSKDSLKRLSTSTDQPSRRSAAPQCSCTDVFALVRHTATCGYANVHTPLALLTYVCGLRGTSSNRTRVFSQSQATAKPRATYLTLYDHDGTDPSGRDALLLIAARRQAKHRSASSDPEVAFLPLDHVVAGYDSCGCVRKLARCSLLRWRRGSKYVGQRRPLCPRNLL